MLLRPRAADLRVIGLYTGRIIFGVGLLMAVPLATALIAAEWAPAVDFVIGMCACLAFGLLTEIGCRTSRDPTWTHGLVVAGFSWLAATAIGAIPHWLSGHYGSFLDAMFDLMSGYTTTGLILIQDLDHVSHGLNMWRFLLTYAGGQGIIVIALTFLVGSASGAYPMYVGEGKDERLLPNVIRTARAIWLVSLVYLAVSTPFCGSSRWRTASRRPGGSSTRCGSPCRDGRPAASLPSPTTPTTTTPLPFELVNGGHLRGRLAELRPALGRVDRTPGRDPPRHRDRSPLRSR